MALQASNARNFMVSYVMLQGPCCFPLNALERKLIFAALGLMPLQLINLGPLLTLGYARAFSTKTPRGDYIPRETV